LILENGNGQQQPQIEVTADASEDQPEIQKEGDLTENIVETEALPEQPPQQEPLSNDDTKIDEEPEQTTRTQQQPQEEKLLSEQEFNRGNKVSDQEQPTQQKQVLKDGDILIDPTAPLDNTQENEDEDDDLLPNNSSSDADRQSEFKDQIKRLLMQGKALANDEDYDNKKGYAYDDEHEEGEYDIENEEEPSKREQLGRFLEQYNNEKAKKHDIAKDGPATELSNDILSYERFFPGRILGNTFTVINKTKEKISMKLNFTANGIDKDYMSKKLMEFYEVSNVEEVEHPYLNYLQQPIIDVQKEFEWWFIEDPYAKTLVKEADYELKPGESFEFIIVLKSPVVKKARFLTTNVNISNLTHNEEHSVFAFGSLDIPKLSCPKEIMDKDNNYAWVKVVMRKRGPLQVFKFLLLNRGDMPINVTFSSLENDEMLIFTIKNPWMIIEGGTRAILEVRARHKYAAVPEDMWKTTNNHKLIIGKIKDCELKFSLIVNVIII